MKYVLPLVASTMLSLGLCACSPAENGEGASSSSASLSSAVSSPAAVSEIEVGSPLPDATVHSPLEIKGMVRGNWFSEASFPVSLLDDHDVEIARGTASPLGEWMTADFVPFSAELTFTTSAKTGTLLLQNDNPSGLPGNDKSVRIPVNF